MSNSQVPHSYGSRYIKADQATARQCHIQAIHLSKQAVCKPEEAITGDVLAIERDGSKITVEELDPREDYPKPEPIEQTEEIQIRGEGRITRIGTRLNQDQKMEMTLCLRENSDVFAWSAAEMPGIPPSIISHSLSINPLARPVKQKKRKLGPERLIAVRQETSRQETSKLLKAGFVREVHYPDWLSNVVMVKKTSGKWRMCVDFTDLNKACPKTVFHSPLSTDW